MNKVSWNGNPNFLSGSDGYNAPITYNDGIFYNGTLQLSDQYLPNGAIWAKLETGLPTSKVWLGNPLLGLGSIFYNDSSKTYNSSILYNDTTELNSIYNPDGVLWSASSLDTVEDENKVIIEDEYSNPIYSEDQLIVSDVQPQPALWNGNPEFNDNAYLYNSAVTYNAAVLYNSVAIANLTTIRIPTGTIWKEAN